MNGPSSTVRFPPRANLMRAPFELGCSPARSSSTPAFASSSLYRVISASSFSSGMTPASVFLSAFTNIMKRIRMPPLSVVGGLVGQGPEIAAHVRRIWGRPGALGHQDADQVLLRVRIPGGAETAIPAEPSNGPRQILAPGDH